MTDLSDIGPPPPRDPERDRAEREQLMAAWQPPAGWRRISAVNNSLIGKWYLLTAFAFFGFAGVLALLIRTQLAVPDNDFLSMRFYNQVFTLHGTAMMFLFAIPIFEAVAILILPEMLGARDLPFPRLSAFGFWCFAIGGVFVCGSILFDAAPDGGWFMYPPLSSDPGQTGIGTDIWLLGLSFIEVASIAAAIELIVGVLKCRPPGMRINLMPLYCWYVLVVAGMILFAFPPLIAGDLLLEMERAFGWAFFDADRGGDPLLWQHLFWIFGHPEVYIIFLPSIALIATMLPALSRAPVVGHSWVVLSAIGVAFLSFGLWVHHMFTTGLPDISLGFFSAASEAVAIPTGIQIFCLLATLLVGRAKLSVPLLFAGGALAVFVFGGLTGVMVAVVPFDYQAHDSYFVVAHLHYTLIGGMLFPVFAAVCYWYPFVTDRVLSERLGRWSFWLIFAGFNITFLPMHWTGILGMPRRVWTYAEEMGWHGLNLTSTIGSYILAAGIAVLAFDVLRPKGRQSPAPADPWGAPTLEWAREVPRRPWGIRSVPVISSRYPLWQQPGLANEVLRGEWFLSDSPDADREMIVTDILDARPMFVQRVPGPGFVTILAAASLGAVFILATFHLWLAAVLAGAVFLVATLRWLWTGAGGLPSAPTRDCGRGLVLPLYASGNGSVGWWAMFITMIGDSTAFAGLVFAYVFFWTLHGSFPPPGTAPPAAVTLWLGTALLAGSWGMLVAASAAMSRRVVALCCCALAPLPAGAGVAVLAGAAWSAGLDPTRHAYDATVWVLTLWIGAHVAGGIVMQLYSWARLLARHMDADHDAELRNTVLYWNFLIVQAAATFALIGLFPLVSGGVP
ncbi:cytochrome c oxidase subunit I [Defluviimonas sp. WL0002]|uniref:cytochrome-c oxidase n=1 Tax=Albidovulum marisflavi TaxID=2984159 RepID=A0ABT2ZCI5_9RHOB|nr:cytochrome c oxidase subunit I [Defluviimonas sp. WL0002]MCV2868844.1 cytochrome c oxidase subunit I [Defluviimonas sp. WL0002]